MIKRDLGVYPGQVLLQAVRPVQHYTRLQSDILFVETLEELPAEELDAHDGKHEPEDQADQQDVQYGGDGEHESVDHNLHALPPGDRSQRPQCSQCPQGSEGCQVGVVLHSQTEDGNLTMLIMKFYLKFRTFVSRVKTKSYQNNHKVQAGPDTPEVFSDSKSRPL